MNAVIQMPTSAEGRWASLAAYGVRTPAEVLAETAGRAPFLVDGIVHSGLTLIYGQSEIGKSYLVVSLATAVAAGIDWMGRQTNGGPGRVLVLASDPGDVWEYARRLGDVDTDNVGVARPPSPDDPNQWADLAEICSNLGVRMVVVDNLYSWAPSRDITVNAEVGQALACLDPLINQGVAVLLVHHTPKAGGKTPAGAHSILAKARHSIYLTADAMTVHGNTVAESVYAIERQEGRVIGIAEGLPTVAKPRQPKKPHQKRVDRSVQEREALAALSSLPKVEMSERGMAKFLIGKVDRVDSPGQGRGLVQYMVESEALVKGVDTLIRLAGDA